MERILKFTIKVRLAASRRWIVDPIDGTTNFAHGYPLFCISIAFEEAGVIKAGVVYNPVMNELFTAEKDKGAFLNGKAIHVCKLSSLMQDMLVTGFPYDLDHPDHQNVHLFTHMIRKAQAVRRDGSAALDLAFVAAGRFDGFWEKSLKAWDFAAGTLLVKEAGGTVTHISGRDLEMTDHAVIACGPAIHKDLLQELKEAEQKLT
jgi:myo-inositol-1(or 4)-monophosphatase